VYFDAATFNMWLRNKCSWSYYNQPIHHIINEDRGCNITVHGAISSQFHHRALFVQTKTTNGKSVAKFMEKLRGHFHYARNKRIKVVLDNARPHISPIVKSTIERLRIDFLFMPTCTPELNSIECLWSVIKRDFKRRLAEVKFEKLNQQNCKQILQASLNAITPETQATAAVNNNRQFLDRIWGMILADEKGSPI